MMSVQSVKSAPLLVVKSVQNVPLLVVQPGVVEEMREQHQLGVVEEMRERLQPEELPETV